MGDPGIETRLSRVTHFQVLVLTRYAVTPFERQ